MHHCEQTQLEPYLAQEDPSDFIANEIREECQISNGVKTSAYVMILLMIVLIIPMIRLTI